MIMAFDPLAIKTFVAKVYLIHGHTNGCKDTVNTIYTVVSTFIMVWFTWPTNVVYII
jgi:hypothetical protein